MKLALVLVAVLAAPALAQPRREPKKSPPPIIDMDGMKIDGRLRGVQLLYFLDRANEELDRASLEKRSFIPELVRTLDEEQL
jgi:hypothetical protein